MYYFGIYHGLGPCSSPLCVVLINTVLSGRRDRSRQCRRSPNHFVFHVSCPSSPYFQMGDVAEAMYASSRLDPGPLLSSFPSPPVSWLRQQVWWRSMCRRAEQSHLENHTITLLCLRQKLVTKACRCLLQQLVLPWTNTAGIIHALCMTQTAQKEYVVKTQISPTSKSLPFGELWAIAFGVHFIEISVVFIEMSISSLPRGQPWSVGS